MMKLRLELPIVCELLQAVLTIYKVLLGDHGASADPDPSCLLVVVKYLNKSPRPFRCMTVS